METIQIRFELPGHLHRAAKMAAAAGGTTLRDYLITAIEAYMRMEGEELPGVKACLDREEKNDL